MFEPVFITKTDSNIELANPFDTEFLHKNLQYCRYIAHIDNCKFLANSEALGGKRVNASRDFLDLAAKTEKIGKNG